MLTFKDCAYTIYISSVLFLWPGEYGEGLGSFIAANGGAMVVSMIAIPSAYFISKRAPITNAWAALFCMLPASLLLTLAAMGNLLEGKLAKAMGAYVLTVALFAVCNALMRIVIALVSRVRATPPNRR